ncbi:Alkylglycerol monooxygenase [Trichostrongylus colubriformis]|uniref:Alkylglycerol monooxygenase n=1 Tax=Trichostrongylus colubriformis TaxID=6319 RepID=A0AAN8G6Y0_TRICO
MSFFQMLNILHKMLADLNPYNLRSVLYMGTPNGTFPGRMEDVPNFFKSPATSWLFFFVALEYVMLDEKKREFKDTITSINAGILYLLLQAGGRFLSVSFYPMVYDRLHVIELPKNSLSTWILCIFTQDFAYYIGHRAIHEAGVFWAFHQMHHSSEYFNFATAVRLGAYEDVGLLLFDLLQAFAIPPNIFVVNRYLFFTWFFWLHTTTVPRLGPLEYFLSTPSSHRVHHGRNPYCIDRNYGGVFIIWDRLFGTYEPERKDEEIVYGLVKPVASFNQLWCQFFSFKAIGYDKGQMRKEKNEEIFPGVWNKIKAALWPPAYFPGMRTKPFFLWLCMEDNTEGNPEIKRPVILYNPPLSMALRCYLFVQWVLLLSSVIQFDELRHHLSWPEFLGRLGLLIAVLQMFGYYFDHSRFAVVFDSTRLMLSMLFGVLLNDSWMTIHGVVSLAAVSWLACTGRITMTEKKAEKSSE